MTRPAGRPLTARQGAYLHAIRSWIHAHKRPPSVEDVAAVFRCCKSTAERAIRRLIDRGLLRREKKALVVTDGGPCPYCTPPAAVIPEPASDKAAA